MILLYFGGRNKSNKEQFFTIAKAELRRNCVDVQPACVAGSVNEKGVQKGLQEWRQSPSNRDSYGQPDLGSGLGKGLADISPFDLTEQWQTGSWRV
ncbi:unnamed protein product [Leptosia nina]|uniref:Uncharacterized protein n=1 Tax=Leptosia nina TaxID=320188 RepID=A0AAV1JF26_9NEOP